jgi:hypothetical protein
MPAKSSLSPMIADHLLASDGRDEVIEGSLDAGTLSGVSDVLIAIGTCNSESDELEEVTEEGELVNHINGGSEADLGNCDRDEDDHNGGLLGVSSLLPDILMDVVKERSEVANEMQEVWPPTEAEATALFTNSVA